MTTSSQDLDLTSLTKLDRALVIAKLAELIKESQELSIEIAQMKEEIEKLKARRRQEHKIAEQHVNTLINIINEQKGTIS